MTRIEAAHYAQMYTALKRITNYEKPERLRRIAERDYGLPDDEVIEMAYENVLGEARLGLRKVRKPSL